MTILAIDPGKRIGYALFTDKGEDIERGIVDFDDWVERPAWGGGIWDVCEPMRDLVFQVGMRDRYVTRIVCEDFTHDPNVRQGGSKHEAAQVIGSVKTLAMLSGTPLAMQPASVLSVAMLVTGYEKPVTRTGNKKHLPDEDSAWLHGRYWLHAQEIL